MMESFLLLGICFVLGIGLRVGGVVDEKGPMALNAAVIYMSLPALALAYGHSLPLGAELLLPAAMAWIVFGVGYAFFRFMGRIFGLDEKTVACLTIVAGLGNTSFVGLPMIEAFFGVEYLGVGMLCDQAGTFMALAIPGIMLAAKVSGQGVDGRTLVGKIVFFPPFIALVAGLALQPVSYPDWLSSLLSRLGATLTPLALLSVGMTLRLREIRGNGRTLAIGLGYKLFLAPAMILVLYMGILGQTDMVSRVTIFESAMGPMITGGIIAMTYGLDPRLAASLLGVGIPLSFVTLPAWYWLLTAL
jgi:predicted permease